MKRWRGSLRVRLLAVVVVLLAVGLFAVNLTVIVTLQSFALDRIDKELRAVPLLSAELRQNAPLAPPVGLTQYLNSTVVTLLDKDTGAVVQQVNGPALSGQALPDLGTVTEGLVEGVLAADSLVTVPDLAGTPDAFRVRIIMDTTTNSDRVVVVARSLVEVKDTVRRVAVTDGLISLVLLVALVGIGSWLLRVGLRPLTEVESAAARIRDGDLSVRAPHSQDGNEVDNLAMTFNSMLDQIETAFADKQATEAQLRRFVADASHELRTPLTSIRAYSELFASGALPADSESLTAMRRIEAEATRMGLLVDDLLLLARLDHTPELRFDHVDLAELAREVVADAETAAPEHRWLLTSAGRCGLVADELRLRQVVANLTRNAAVHAPAGTTVRVLVTDAGNGVELSVSDDGPGMAPGDAEHAFDRFYRADQGRARSSAGTGLGLSIVAAIVAAHGGTASISSEVGVGTTVTVTLPRTPPLPEEDSGNPQET